jgi:glycosyltransferase involved in cell wall biosynthesis
MKQKRLLILVWNLGIGGVQKRIRDISKEISKKHQNWEVYIFVRDRYPSHFAGELVNYKRINIVYFPPSRAIGRLSSLIWFAGQYANIRPDVCLTFLSYLSSVMIAVKLFCFWTKTRVVLNEGIHTSGFLPIHSKSITMETSAIKLLYKFSDLILVPTKAVKVDLIKNYSVPNKLIKIIPNWTLFKPGQSKTPIYDLIYIGRFEKEKNLNDFVNIVKLLKSKYKRISACLVGDGSYLNDLHLLISQYGLKKNIRILPPQIDVAGLLQGSKLFLLPSQNEGMPNVVLEAAMCGIPTVARRFTGSEEVIQDNISGFLYDDVKGAVSFISKLLTDDSFRKKMGESAISLVSQKFSAKVQSKFMSELLDIN